MLASKRGAIGALSSRPPRTSVLGGFARGYVSPTAYSGLAAWYDVGDYSSLLNNAGSAPSNGDGIKLIADKSGNSAICWANNNSTVAGNSMTAANKSVTGSQTITIDIAKESYRPGSNRTLVGKLSGNNGFEILVLTTGVVRLRVGNGASVTNVDSTAALTNTNFLRTTVGIVWTDGVGASFTQDGAALGSTVAAAVTLTNAAVGITIGLFTGRLFRCQIGSVYGCNPGLASRLAASFSSGGDTWTVNSSGDLGARICGERDLVQLTASKQPTYDAATRSVLFDGTDDYMKAAAFSLSQPESVYFVGQQVSWTSGDQPYDGNSSANRMTLVQTGSTPSLSLFAGATAAANTEMVLGTTAVSTAVFNGASSSNRINRGTASTGNAGAQNANCFLLGAIYDGSLNNANIRASEIIIRSAADATATQDRLIQSLGVKWGLAV